ncbi:MAG: carbohydrate ABC transporter permease [Clostridiales bacterium]|jgi:putative aldouronate transport system permease protein|nr:carbohydrate ABC transporter permease [Clostridiales bacterium]
MKKGIEFYAVQAALMSGLLIFSLFCVLPMVLIFCVSLTSESSIIKNGYSFLPEVWSVEAYKLVFRNGLSILRSYGVSILITAAGTAAAVLVTALGAFTLSNKSVKYRNHLAFFFFFTMLFNAGIVPWYMVCRFLGLQNNILALIVPSLMFSPFNLFLVRNFMAGLPDSLAESAKLDGANEAVIAFRISFPLSMPVLAAVALFYALAYWNDWWNAIMLVDNKNFYPLQYMLFRMQSEIQMIRDLQMHSASSSSANLPAESVKMATVILTVGPIIFLYPFLQKYFVKGLVVGGVKG